MHKPLTTAERNALNNEALNRAETGQSFTNYPAILQGFIAKGLSEADILPRVNVFTYHAWQAKGRQVRRGEKGVKVFTFIVTEDKDTGETRKLPHNSTVFHVSQTDPVQS